MTSSLRGNREWSRWVVGGSIAMAVLAAAALAVTVFVARRSLSAASELIVRGEGAALVGSVEREKPADGALTEDTLRAALERHRSQGLTYVAIVDGDRTVRAQAGTPTMVDRAVIEGDFFTREGVARLVVVMPPGIGLDDGPEGAHRHSHGPDDHHGPPPGPPPGHPEKGDGPPWSKDHGPGDDGPHHGPEDRGGPPLLVIEFAPPVLAELRGHFTRIAVVGGVAGLILLAFALAWSRTVIRLTRVQRQTERERRFVELGQMSGVMAHELRNPLASLKGHAQLLLEQFEDGEVPPGDRARQKAERVVAEAERLEKLMHSLLEFVRDAPLERRGISPAALVEEATADLPKDLLTLDLSKAPKTLDLDPSRTARALQNLVQNAIQATPDGEKVELTVESIDGRVDFEIRDHGEGIPDSVQTQMFEPFVTTRTRGTGLGLSIARRIAEQHGGTLTGVRHPAGGSVFTLRIPGGASS